MKNKLYIFLSLVFVTVILIGAFIFFNNRELNSPSADSNTRQRNLSKYQFDRLSQRQITSQEIKLTKLIFSNSKYSSHIFEFINDEYKKVSGVINIPKYPLPSKPTVVLVRGYVDKEIYTPGMGTKNAAARFATEGFVTIAPDFLGYGSGDPEPNDILESRFEKPLTLLSLISSIKTHPIVGANNLPALSSAEGSVINSPIFMWAHSNGGQIALSVLEITKSAIPTTLWAPVSVGFPESILQFVGELPDKGEYIKKDLEDFTQRYSLYEYSISSYFDQIKAPIQLHYGQKDDSIPQDWIDSLVEALKLKPGISYFLYKDSDHNMRPDWETAILRDVSFFKSFL